MKTDLNYSASDCFETFPFPLPDPRAVIPELEAIGEKLYTERAKYMVDENVGLTTTYNRLKDPGCTEARIVALRALHEEMDRAVLRAYGWEDLVGRVPPYCVSGEADKRALEGFESEVIERLFALNAQRAEEERLAGLGTKQKAPKLRAVPAVSEHAPTAPRLVPPAATPLEPADTVATVRVDLAGLALTARLRRVLGTSNDRDAASQLRMSEPLLDAFSKHIHLVLPVVRARAKLLERLNAAAGVDLSHVLDGLEQPQEDRLAASRPKRTVKIIDSYRAVIDSVAKRVPSTELFEWRNLDEYR